MCGAGTQTLTFREHGGLMVGNPTPKSVQPHKSEQPLKLCDQCGKHGESTGGVEVRKRWYCAKCWVKYVNSR